jgi:hypothetical protein
MALDYRIRYYFGATPLEEMTAAKADQFSNAFKGPFANSLEKLIGGLQPVGRQLSRDDEDQLLRHCVVLALYEECFRSPLALKDSPLLRLRACSCKSLLAIARDHWIDDLRAQSWQFYESSHDMMARPVTLNPRFDGSLDVGGADADFILDGRLIDIKSTVRSDLHKLPDWLRQLVGYVLLDYSDRHRIQSVGFYFARHGVHVSWPLPELLATMTVDENVSLKRLRSNFRRVVERRLWRHGAR